MQISFVMPIFLLFSDQISRGEVSEGANCLRGTPLPLVEESRGLNIETCLLYNKTVIASILRNIGALRYQREDV